MSESFLRDGVNHFDELLLHLLELPLAKEALLWWMRMVTSSALLLSRRRVAHGVRPFLEEGRIGSLTVGSHVFVLLHLLFLEALVVATGGDVGYIVSS